MSVFWSFPYLISVWFLHCWLLSFLFWLNSFSHASGSFQPPILSPLLPVDVSLEFSLPSASLLSLHIFSGSLISLVYISSPSLFPEPQFSYSPLYDTTLPKGTMDPANSIYPKLNSSSSPPCFFSVFPIWVNDTAMQNFPIQKSEKSFWFCLLLPPNIKLIAKFFKWPIFKFLKLVPFIHVYYYCLRHLNSYQSFIEYNVSGPIPSVLHTLISHHTIGEELLCPKLQMKK